MRLPAPGRRRLPLLVGLLVGLGLLGGCIDAPVGGDGHGNDAIDPEPLENETTLLRVPVHIHVDLPAGPDPDLPFWAVTYTRAAEPGPPQRTVTDIHDDGAEAPYGYIEVQPNETVTVLVDGWPRHTAETYPDIRIDAELAATGLHLVVYRADLTLEWNATLDVLVEPTTSRWTGGDAYWAPTAVRLHDDPAVNRAYLERLVRFTVVMDWENTLTQQADLGIGLGLTPDRIDHIVDLDDNPGPGAWEEYLSADLYDHPLLDETTVIYIGPVSHEPIVSAPEGITTHFVLELEFGDQPSGAGTPAPGLALTVLAMVTALGVAARRRRL